jgi:large subunit ribosomal protein L35
LPKLKTHKGAKSRFRFTGSGKIMRVKGPKSHFRTHKSSRTKRQFDEMIEVNKVDRPRLRILMPYGVR